LSAIKGEGKLCKLNFIEVFDCFPKITRQLTFILAGSPMDDFFDGPRTDGRVSNQGAVVFDGVAFLLLDGGAIAAGFASESRVSPSSPCNYPDRRAAFCPRNSIQSIFQFFSSVHRHSAEVEILDSSCFSGCKSLSSV
jgi:hypothetical protein